MNMAIRDMSKKQFEEALARHGMKREGFMGYVNLGIEGQHVSASHHNAGKNRRAKLAYLLRKKAEFEKQIAEENKSKS
jgi:hypothetical protein